MNGASDPGVDFETDLSADLNDFLSKWRGRWPEWRIAQVFVAESQREIAEAWFALLQEWTDAAWAGDDPTPGFAKLVWWQDELLGWSKGAHRHPLGRVLQKQSAQWATLAAALPALQAVREPLRAWTAPQMLMTSLQPLAVVIAEIERVLFAPETAFVPDAFALLAMHALWHRDDAAAVAQAKAWAQQLISTAPQRAGSRPRRIHDALIHARLKRVAANGEVSALLPATALWRSWRAARG